MVLYMMHRLPEPAIVYRNFGACPLDDSVEPAALMPEQLANNNLPDAICSFSISTADECEQDCTVIVHDDEELSTVLP
ncbi:hypothetical protein FRC0429_01910 [Corynebacterium diphtheriae]|nr:hypothetical protein FRC0022_01858 [Corynebacterium diphtheriae]CAB0915389.1 hypothetical protein FRC0429_01910 [Corynebacterium diphtheriae]